MITSNFANRTRRKAFTLLEVMLASVIAVLLMAALYTIMNLQIRQMQDGREAVERATLVRVLFQRIQSDLTATLTPSIRAAASASSTTPSAASTAATGTTGTTPATDTSATAPPATPTDTGTTTATTFQGGLFGDSEQLSIYASRLPSQDAVPAASEGGDSPTPSDLRRITYGIDGGGTGLSRQIDYWLTSETLAEYAGLDSTSGEAVLLAEEVSSIEFSYWDGSDWTDYWDGMALGSDGKTPVGPPAAIRVKLTLKPIGGATAGGEAGTESRYSQVLALPTAPNSANSQTVDPTMMTAP